MNFDEYIVNKQAIRKEHLRIAAALLICASLIVTTYAVAVSVYQIGFENGASSVETRTPNFEMTIVGGYVNESFYNETYYQVYYFADGNPPTLRNDSFILYISILGYYDNVTDVAPFAVKFSDDLNDITNVTIEKAVVDSGREDGWKVGFIFNLYNSSGATAYGLGWMRIFLFGYGSIPGHSSIFASYILTIQEWEV